MLSPPEARRQLEATVLGELTAPVHPTTVAFAERIRSRIGRSAAAVLFYGSCLRRGGDRPPDEAEILDFYALVDDYRSAYPRRLVAWANRLLPPNVFYIEESIDGRRLRAKYAVISLRQFARGVSQRSVQVALWARFAQPSRLVCVRDAEARHATGRALATAAATLVARVLPLMPSRFAPADLWTRAFRETYRAELRAEGSQQALSLYAAAPARYDALTPLILRALRVAFRYESGDGAIALEAPVGATARRRAEASWFVRRVVGKLLNALRILKSIFTFEGGLSYVLWKVERHSGVRLPVTAWQQRHPLLCAPLLAWRLYRRGAFR